MLENEKELLQEAKRGNIDAFEKLILGYQKRVFNIALRMLGNYEDASELAQEVFIKVYKCIGSFKEEAAFSTWIHKITTNTCLDEIRKRKNKTNISLDEEIKLEDGEVSIQLLDQSPSPEALYEQKETKETVIRAIGSLSGEHRAVVILRELQELSYEEISTILNCPVGTVKSRINRARQELREILLNKKEHISKDYVKLNSKEESL